MRNYLTINDVTSKSKGLFISAGASYNSPRRKLSFVTVVGKNGDIVLDDGQFENIEIQYPCFIVGVDERSLEERTRVIANWLHSYTDYAVIRDTYKPNFYRLGVPTGALEWNVTATRAAESTLTFNCKPQLFYVDGDVVQKFTANGTIENPSQFTSKPIIRVYGSGTGALIIGDYRLDFSDIPTYMDIQTEIRYAHKGNQNLNNYVTAQDSVNYMQIDGGKQAVQLIGGVTSVEITGKWWTT